MGNKFKFDVILQNFKRSESALITEVANNGKKYFLKSFDWEEWNGKKWKEVKRRIKGTKEYNYPKRKGYGRRVRKILIGKGTLRRAVNNSIRSKTSKSIKFQVDLPYAGIHNEGLRMKNGKKMPKRQYMGWSPELRRQTQNIVRKYAFQAFKTK